MVFGLKGPPPAKYSALAFSFITLIIIFRSSKSKKKIFELIRNKFFIGGLIVVIIWCFISLRGTGETEEDKKTREATKNAIIALLIAVMAELHLSIAPFWLVWLASYYLDAH
jgi:O-antigen ligase